jgi:hypothetical protein
VAALNFDLILKVILPSLIGSSLWSALIAIAIGTIVGLVIGAIRHRIKRTILPAIVGCFFGTMLICMLPIVSTPGIVGGGAYGGLAILTMAVFLLPLGSICGAVAGSIWGLNLFQKRKQQVGLIMLALTYSIMVIVMYTRITLTCSHSNQLALYCSEAGFSLSEVPRLR